MPRCSCPCLTIAQHAVKSLDTSRKHVTDGKLEIGEPIPGRAPLLPTMPLAFLTHQALRR